MAFTAFYDASVLYPAPLRDVLLRLALTGLFRAKWSALVHEEWMAALWHDRPDLTLQQLERTRWLMDAHARACLVEDFERRHRGPASGHLHHRICGPSQ